MCTRPLLLLLTSHLGTGIDDDVLSAAEKVKASIAAHDPQASRTIIEAQESVREVAASVDGDGAVSAGAAVVASLVAGHLGTRMETDRLRRWFAWLVFVVAAYVLVDTLFLR